jgi:O-acetyl-ADP-ribose deacetylase (regulator of RNase III)
MNIQLVDRNQEMCDAWTTEFMDCDDVIIYCDDFFAPPTDCIVSPANSFGFMRGGLDGVITKHVGEQTETNVKDYIAKSWLKELLVGDAIMVQTGFPAIPYCISAPTMRVSMNIENTVNVYLATKAIFIELKLLMQADSNVKRVTISGLGTGVGNVAPEICAAQMRQAYEEVWLGHSTYPTSLTDAKNKQFSLS